MDINPMKHITNMKYDFKTDCTKKADILMFILKNKI